MTYELVLRAGRVIDPSQGIDRVADVAFAGGRVAAVGDDLAHRARTVHDAAGRIVTPGLIDLRNASREADARRWSIPAAPARGTTRVSSST